VHHGGFSHADLKWTVPHEAALLRRLATFSRVIMFDRRGSGASDRFGAEEHPTWEQWSDDLLAVLDAVGATVVALFAESDSGAMALKFTASHAERVSALILGNSAARYCSAPDYPIGVPPGLITESLALINEGWGTAELGRYCYPSQAHDDRAMAALATHMRAAATPRVASDHLNYMYHEFDARGDLKDIRVPTLVMGNRRRASDESAAEQARARVQYVADNIKGAKLVEFPGIDLRVGAENLEEVVDEVARFLTGQSAPSSAGRFLTTVLFTDIVGSTERAIQLGDRRWSELLDTHDDGVRHHLARNRGKEIKTTGDGFLACFGTPSEAIRCALDIASSAKKLGIEVRAGLHSGECEWRGDDIAGVAVHVAARISALAGPGQVLVSRTVSDLVDGSGLGFGEGGSHQLKGLPGTWDLFTAVGESNS